MAGVVVNGGVGSYWAETWRVQQQVLAGVVTSVPVLPAGSSVLLAGVCPYAGPTPVSESHWDLAGALQLAYPDGSLRANVVTPEMSFETETVATRIYGIEARHTYGDDLLLYDADRGGLTALPTQQEARREVDSVAGPPCPPGSPGRGAVALPFDRVYAELEARGFRPWRSRG